MAWALTDRDVLAGARAWRLWTTWAWLDMLQRYRRSMIGPFWTTLSMGLTVGGMGVVFGTLFNQKLSDFFPFLTAGMITWQLISTLITESCLIFIANERIIKQLNLPLSIYAQRNTMKQLIIFAHHFVIYIVIAFIFGIRINFATLIAPIGIAIIYVNGFLMALLVGTLCTRFRDIPPIVTNLVQLAFFVTPVMWKPELLGDRAYIAHFNPLTHFVEIVRRPLLGEMPDMISFIFVGVTTIVFGIVGLWFFGRYRHRIAYWV